MPGGIAMTQIVIPLAERTHKILKTFQFAHSEDTHGYLEWNVYSQAYKTDKAALNTLVQHGYIELVVKERKRALYKITDKGLAY
jgi:DNA-binding PadR family transcriptional regulator